jgi:hypothetical protein
MNDAPFNPTGGRKSPNHQSRLNGYSGSRQVSGEERIASIYSITAIYRAEDGGPVNRMNNNMEYFSYVLT